MNKSCVNYKLVLLVSLSFESILFSNIDVNNVSLLSVYFHNVYFCLYFGYQSDSYFYSSHIDAIALAIYVESECGFCSLRNVRFYPSVKIVI